MARIIPDGWEAIQASGAAQREIETLGVLARSLPDAYTVYHAVHWSNLERGHAVYGEIDFVIANAAGHLLVIEQKSGFLEETADGLVKVYASKEKSVAVQIARTVAALTARLRARPGCADAVLEHLLYCPDYTVRQPHAAGIAPGRIVDAPRRGELAACIQQILPTGEPRARAREVDRFLRDIIQLETDVSALIGRAQALVTRISGGLAQWARNLDFSPWRLRVTGTAGSGKTQLALAEYQAAVRAGRRPLYLCFNRPLADHFAAIAPAGGLALTFHALCERRLRQAGEKPDFGRVDAFDRLAARAAQLPVADGERFDTVIVDEGQDFLAEWRGMVLAHARPEARLLWLEDPLQNLYGRPPVDLPGWVRLSTQANYRSPRAVVGMLERLMPGTHTEAFGPFVSADVEVLTYVSAADLRERVKDAIRVCLSAGFKRSDMAVVTFHGRKDSLLLPYTQLGPHRLTTFTGRYDLFGNPVYCEGDVVMESVYRFKGQSAPAIIFAEIDFAELDERTLRKLFVGMTRAMMKLVLVVSERSAATLVDRLP